jgi:hypothetical protein
MVVEEYSEREGEGAFISWMGWTDGGVTSPRWIYLVWVVHRDGPVSGAAEAITAVGSARGRGQPTCGAVHRGCPIILVPIMRAVQGSREAARRRGTNYLGPIDPSKSLARLCTYICHSHHRPLNARVLTPKSIHFVVGHIFVCTTHKNSSHSQNYRA